LAFDHIKCQGRDTCEASEYRVYKCQSCAGCGLAADCLRGNSQRRTVSHDQHEAVRQEVAARLKTESGKKAYARRAHLAETPNGYIKQVIRLRQFLLRGLDKVRTEWLSARGKMENSSSETPFMDVKTTGETPVPQYHHRLLWAHAAFNIRKLILAMGTLRAEAESLRVEAMFRPV